MQEPQQRPIPESYWVLPGCFLAGEYPGSVTEASTTRRLNAFLQAGFTSFVNLTMEEELPPYDSLLSEQATEYKLDVNHLRFPIGDFGIPDPAQMKAVLDAIDSALTTGHKVYLHCWGGIGRTGTIVGCYLVRHGRTGEEALRQLAEWWRDVPKSAVYPRTPETDRQADFIRQWKE